MILIFDLDDTLYDESTYVESGFKAVADEASRMFGWDRDRLLALMNDILAAEGRGQVFDQLLRRMGKFDRTTVDHMVKVYRWHRPTINLFENARAMIDRYKGHVPLYVVTDGHKIVQRNKVDALELWPDFKRIMITHRFGRHRAKPSPYCFDRIRTAERCRWEDLVYVGDNPAKDFVSLNGLGARTVRVLTGSHRRVTAKPGYDAAVTIGTLDELPDVLG